MQNIIFVPIELLEERYSAQWYDWFRKSFDLHNVKPIVVGDLEKKTIQTGQFLDSVDTCIYKNEQMNSILKLVKNGFEGKIFFMDGWFPGIEHLAYMRNNAKKKIELICILHAGTWDVNDFLFQNGCRMWAKHTERGWLEIYDKIIVATKYHKNLIIDMNSHISSRTADKIVVTQFPVYRDKKRALRQARKNIVVFPHRLATEKQPDFFDQVRDVYYKRHGETLNGEDVTFIRTKDVCKTKAEYYDILSNSKVVFSSALQETFGIAMLEGWALGCYPVAPDRLSYIETLNGWPRYKTLSEAVGLIHTHLKTWKPGIENLMPFVDNANSIIQEVLS